MGAHTMTRFDPFALAAASDYNENVRDIDDFPMNTTTTCNALSADERQLFTIKGTRGAERALRSC